MMEHVQDERKHINIDISLLLILFVCLSSACWPFTAGRASMKHRTLLFAKRQVFWYLVGFGVMAGTAYIDYELLERLALRLFVGAVFF
ncbi:hypothetical protein PO124_28385 [Bacillus licheniformis]|nr:hypothetical protein [Bacillus licheniformis]